MQHYAILRLLLAGFFLYVAWPVIPSAVTPEAVLFWGAWLGFFVLVVGANFATLMQMTEPPIMEQDRTGTRQQA
ncbi:hypothetical protein [Lentibacillus salicampi]|uniref:Uncharacterized protein n=1 Tax=Lentibacillus salicampi TaxID=175306 RepID=A0A4Y9ADC5_9BACI|nr:hypothetical protein [Lentibacillus salicampi]TFJ93889.1 hypothetical protein E4U82_03500 [Lentibacillus salicampi]